MFADTAQTIVKKAAAMMDGKDGILKFNRIYYAYLRKTGSGGLVSGAGGDPAAAVDLSEMEHTFGRAMVVNRLGQFIMDVKVRFCVFRDRFIFTTLCGRDAAQHDEERRRMDRLCVAATDPAVGAAGRVVPGGGYIAAQPLHGGVWLEQRRSGGDQRGARSKCIPDDTAVSVIT